MQNLSKSEKEWLRETEKQTETEREKERGQTYLARVTPDVIYLLSLMQSDCWRLWSHTPSMTFHHVWPKPS